ncbi:MAG: prolyl aminopeptidase [Beijerinckiaceae bacterium]
MNLDTRTSPSGSGLYPGIAPHRTGMLETGDGHELYWEVCGNPQGKAAVFLHGGPGGSCQPDHRRLFDPSHYRIVLFDQRGSGKSRPKGSLENNTTAHLVADMELLREHLEIDDWLVLGGSWGAALALAYAQAHPARVRAMVLRGTFTARQEEVDWLYKFGASSLFPEAWQKFLAPVPLEERGDLVAAYHRRLTDPDEYLQREYAGAWCAWESVLLTMKPRPARTPSPATPGELALARIEAHYFVNGSFLDEGQLLKNAGRLAGIPGVAVQGRYDVITPARTAHELCQIWTGCRLEIVPDAGHATSEPGILAALVRATDGFRGV